MLRVTRDFYAAFGYRHYVYSAAIRETLIKSDNDLISISKHFHKMSVVTLLLPPSHGRGMPEGQGVGQSRKRAKLRNLSCTPDITTGVLGGRLNTSRFSSSNIQRFPACKGDPSAALGMTVREAASAFP